MSDGCEEEEGALVEREVGEGKQSREKKEGKWKRKEIEP